MSIKTENSFVEVYGELDVILQKYLGVSEDGITQYINKLNSIRSAPHREATLQRLVRYRAVYVNITRTESSRSKVKVKSSDVLWMRRFICDIECARDPISLKVKKDERIKEILKNKWVMIGIPVIMLFLIAAALTVLLVILADSY